MSSSWLAAYQRAVDNASSQSKNLREYIVEKQASLGTLEEAKRQLRETVSAVTTTVAQTAQRATNRNELVEREMAREMAEYGITEEYVEAVISKLEYGVFRDHKLDDRADAGPTSGRHADAEDKRLRLNAWQERHVILLMKRVKEVDALRFTLCPKYMDDGVFWAIYFELVRKMLPTEAYEYEEGGDFKLPRRYEDVVEEHARKNPGGLDFLESRLREMRALGDRFRGADTSEDSTSARKESKESKESEESKYSKGPAPNRWDTEEGEERGEEDRPGDAPTSIVGYGLSSLHDRKDDGEDGEYLRRTMDADEVGEGEALEDDELDAYLDTLALSDSDDGAGGVVADDEERD